MTTRLNVLAIGAHPDDVEFTCAGTLALLAREGASIAIATMTPGDCGSDELLSEQISSKRTEEARRSAALLKGDHRCLDFRDLRIFVDHETVRRATELVRKVAPDLVFAPSPQDYMLDHENTSAIARAACFNASVPNYDTEARPAASPTRRIPHLYYCDPIEHKDLLGRPVEPTILVNISDVIETKTQMLACHASQREWLRRQHGTDHYIDFMKELAQARGCLAGWDFAEGFRQHLGHAYPGNDILSGTLGSNTVLRGVDKT